MVDRKFTPPTEFPAEYVNGDGAEVVILGRSPVGDYPLIGYVLHADDKSDWPDRAIINSWTEVGKPYSDWPKNLYDLHDIPKRIATWHNVYYDWVDHQCSTRSDADEHHHHSVDDYITDKRLCVYRIERDEDGGNPEIFVEKVEDFKEEV